VGYRVMASLVPDGTDVLLTPESAEVTTVIGDLDLSGLVEQIVGSEPIRICVAEKLPEGVTISGIEVRNGLATLDLSASNFVLSAGATRRPRLHPRPAASPGQPPYSSPPLPVAGPARPLQGTRKNVRRQQPDQAEHNAGSGPQPDPTEHMEVPRFERGPSPF